MLFVHVHTAYESARYKVFTGYYTKLVNILPASDLSHYFVSDKIITITDHERIIGSSVPQVAAKLLLDKVSVQLHNGNSMVLNKMLLIMEYRGGTITKEVSREMRTKLSTIKCEDYSNEQSKLL